MFKILGADGKEYGPVTVDQIRQWIKDGRANHETMAEKMGEIGWKPLAQYAEFSDLFRRSPPRARRPRSLPRRPPSASRRRPRSAAGDARARAKQLVSGPAIALIVTAVLGMAVQRRRHRRSTWWAMVSCRRRTG